MGRAFLAALVVAAWASVYPAVALGDQLCASAGGTFGPGGERSLGLTWTWKSVWSHIEGVPYREFRYRSDGTISYQHDVPSGVIYSAFPNCTNGVCSDAFRRTAVKNLGTKTYSWDMDQRALGAC
jgi:hypothetical protein